MCPVIRDRGYSSSSKSSSSSSSSSRASTSSSVSSSSVPASSSSGSSSSAKMSDSSSGPAARASSSSPVGLRIFVGGRMMAVIFAISCRTSGSARQKAHSAMHGLFLDLGIP
ncbi:MAG: hypothetical protein CVU68_11020 [Deltaproteobacteria bacterium HGW-Deltaproteobacteria-3]|nr:MAG: hypothetical protein CVU68_11020 [Deltaproteobacteria bacterium HGW-Deltaproteobacteria-3]